LPNIIKKFIGVEQESDSNNELKIGNTKMIRIKKVKK
jgi:hypothetical protein